MNVEGPYIDVFRIEIDKSKSVCDLKEAIRDQNPVAFGTVDPESLRLWHVFIRLDARLKDTVKAQLRPVDKILLNPLAVHKDVFPNKLDSFHSPLQRIMSTLLWFIRLPVQSKICR
jgi:hypothetical protein